MTEMADMKKFSFVSKCLHWGLFLLVCANFYLISQREHFMKGDPRKMEYLGLHKSIGILIFTLAIVFIVWHIAKPRPVTERTMSKGKRILSKSVHGILFLLLVAMPLSGYVMSVSAGYSVSFFGLFHLPMFMGKNPTVSDLFFEIHESCGLALTILVLFHVFASFYHHIICKDNVLRRMLPFGKISSDNRF